MSDTSRSKGIDVDKSVSQLGENNDNQTTTQQTETSAREPANRLEALNELTRISQELGLYDNEPKK